MDIRQERVFLLLISLKLSPLVSAQSHPEVLAVDGALNVLGEIDPRKVKSSYCASSRSEP